jgi:aspartate aminotransferase-like enzyme
VDVKLMTPGPTALLEEARVAMSAPIMHHRTEEFRAIVRECREGLKAFYRTPDDVVILTASGSGGMEAALVNLLSPGDKVLVASCGKFGERWADLAKAYGIEAEHLKSAVGDSIDPARIGERLRATRPRALFVTASETSVGVKNDVEAIVRAAKDASPETLVVADAITAIGAFRFETGAWGLDAVVCGSQKALSLPPGLAFVSLSPRAREAAARSRLPRHYFDLPRELKKQADGDIGFTPAITLVVGLRASLAHFLRQGMEGVWADAARRAAATRAGLEAMGIVRVPRTAVSESVTAAWVPEGIDGQKLLKDLQAGAGIKIAGGQGDLKGRIFRISHFGPVTDEDTVACLSGIEDLMRRAGRSVTQGAAAAAAEGAMRSFA